MAFIGNLLGNIQNGLSKVGNAFFGAVPQVQQPQQSVMTVYPNQDMQAFMDNLPNNQSLMAQINKSPYNQGYSNDEVKQKIAQGFNLGVPEIAQEQAKWGINIPKTDFQKDMANLGQFNFYPTQLNLGTAAAQRQGGIFNDIASGARENYSQGFNSSNWGGNKSLATRIGEGIGTGLRWFDTPLGRGLAAMGLSALTGYGTPLEEFATATVGRQQNKTKNQLYRQDLAKKGIDTSNITGNITEDIYKNLVNSNKLNNQVKWGDLAQLSPEIAEAIEKDPDMADSYAPASVINSILKQGLTNAQIDKIKADTAYTSGAKTQKTLREAENVGKPKVTVNIKKGGTHSTIEHKGGSGGGSTKGGKQKPNMPSIKKDNDPLGIR